MNGELIAEEIKMYKKHPGIVNRVYPHLDSKNKEYAWVKYQIFKDIGDDVVSDSLIHAANCGYKPSNIRDYPDIYEMEEIRKASFSNYIMYDGLMLCEKDKKEEPVWIPKELSNVDKFWKACNVLKHKLKRLCKWRIRFINEDDDDW